MINLSGKQNTISAVIFSVFFLQFALLQGSSESIPLLSFEDESIPKISLEDDRQIPVISLEEEAIPRISFEKKEIKKSESKRAAQQVEKMIPVEKKRIVPQKKGTQTSAKSAPLVVKKEQFKKEPILSKEEKKSKVQEPRSRLVIKEDPGLDLTKTAPDSLKMSKEKKESPLLLSTAWKEMMQEDFYKKTQYISEIVNQGEEDPQEKEDFVERFQKNKEWVNASLAATSTVADPYFDALMQRKERIDVLVKTQKQADQLIHKMSMIKKVPESLQSKLRLAVLYALNDLISSTNQVPSLKKIEALVEEKALIYGSLKDKEQLDAEPTNILNAELMHQIKKLKKKLATESKQHAQAYEAIKKELEAKERLAEEIRIKNEKVIQDLEAKSLALKMQEEKAKDAELKAALMQQVQKEIEFNAHKDMEATNKKSLLLEISLAEAEKEKFEAEKALRKALSDYKEMKELVSLLQQQSDDLSTDNQTLLLNLERTNQEKSTLTLEKQHAQRQFDRLQKELAQLQERLVEQKKQTDRLKVTLEKSGNEKKYVLSQVATMKEMQKRQKETEQKLQARVASLNQRLDASSKKNLELHQLISTLKEEYQLTLAQIQEIELLRNESLENSTLLRKEISRLLKDQTRQKVRSEELASLLEQGQISRKEKKGLKKELKSLKEAQEQTGLELGVIQDLYETEQLQQDNLSIILQDMKAQIFDQEGQLEELEKRSAQQKIVVPVGKDLVEDESKLIALKRKNRALKNKIKALERSMQGKSASKEDEYFAKDHTKIESEQEAKPELKFEAEQKEEPKQEVVTEEKDDKKVIKKDKGKKKSLKKEEKVVEEKGEKEDSKPSSRPIEEIIGSFSQTKKETKATPSVKQRAIPQREKVKQRSMQKMPENSSPSKEAESPSASSSSASNLSESTESEQKSSVVKMPEFKKEDLSEGMKEVVDALQKGIQEDPEAFKQMMTQAAENITEKDIIDAHKAIEAMSPEEKEEFTAFIGNMMEAMPPELLSGEMFQPKK